MSTSSRALLVNSTTVLMTSNDDHDDGDDGVDGDDDVDGVHLIFLRIEDCDDLNGDDFFRGWR